MSASPSNVRDLVKKEISPRTRLKDFAPGGDNVVAAHPARFIRREASASPAAKPPEKIVSVVIELETASAGQIYRGLNDEKIVEDETVRRLVNACEKHDDAWITLMRDGRRGHSGPVYADLLEAQVADHHLEPFRRAVGRIPGIKQVFVPRA